MTGLDNIIILGDRSALAILRKEYPDFPADVTMEAPMEDIWMRDPTAVHMSNPVSFAFAPKYISSDLHAPIQNAFRNFLAQQGITLPTSPIVLDGGTVVDNDVDTAIVTTRLYDDNTNYRPGASNWASQLLADLGTALGYPKVAVISQIDGDTTGHADGMVSFIDTNTVAMTDLGDDHTDIQEQLHDQLPNMDIVLLSSIYVDETWRSFSSACGLHINLLATDRALYVPTFGDDPANKEQSFELDEIVLDEIQEGTTKEVIPVPVPHKVCRMGGNVRCLSWQVKGPVADTLVRRAQANA